MRAFYNLLSFLGVLTDFRLGHGLLSLRNCKASNSERFCHRFRGIVYMRGTSVLLVHIFGIDEELLG